ncbi:hypothetical protein Pfo_031425 [Paulownia fortunei]|nr:hypothetical protein Pfo_031425 [Paulownia fortunei]
MACSKWAQVKKVKTCAICLGSVETGQGQAIFTAECFHSFHFGFIGNTVTHGNYICPVCHATLNVNPFHYSANLFFKFPNLNPPVFEPEPLQFSDDEPLPADIPQRQAFAASESIPHFAVLVGIRAPPSLSEDARQIQRAPIDLVTVLDVSGSMLGSKLALLKCAVNFVIDNLGPSDRLSIVSFLTHARRIFPLCRMMEHGYYDAKRAVNSLLANGTTNIVEGLKKGVQVLEERHHQIPVSSIIFLSDGRDICHCSSQFHTFSDPTQPPQYLHLLPASICSSSRSMHLVLVQTMILLQMHAISDSSRCTFSFIESYEMVQDAFASCIGSLLSVVIQELHLMVRSASHGVEIKSIPSGRYASEISNQGSQGTITVKDLYADEEKGFLINLSVPILTNAEREESKRNTSVLDITCSYRGVSKEMVWIEGNLVEIRRLESSRSTVLASASGQAGDALSGPRLCSLKYECTCAYQRAMTRASNSAAAFESFSFGSGGPSAADRASFGAYVTPNMANMVNKSQQLNKTEDATPRQE